MAGSPIISGPVPDYDQEASKLFQLLNLPASGAASSESSLVHRYHDLDAVWEHPRTGARVFIGNAYASKNAATLKKHGITRIVNCTSDMPNSLEGAPGIAYYRFDIYRHMVNLGARGAPGGVLAFFTLVFDWVDQQVDAGHSVLIHCLAGAHRAGTTGVAYTMHAANLDHQTAIAACKACRPIVDPIGDLTLLLKRLEGEREVARREARAKQPAADEPAPKGDGLEEAAAADPVCGGTAAAAGAPAGPGSGT